MESTFNLGNMVEKIHRARREMSNPPAGGKQKLPGHEGVKSALSNNGVHPVEHEPTVLCSPLNALKC